MTLNQDPLIPTKNEIFSFLKFTPPFSDIDQTSLKELSERCSLELFSAGSEVLTRGQSQVTHLGLLQRGRIKVFFRDENEQEKLIDYNGSGMAIWALNILRGNLSNLNIVTTEESVFIQISREDFLELVDTHAHISQYYLKLLSKNYVGKVLTEIFRPSPSQLNEGSLSLFTAQVGDVVRRRPETINGDYSIQEAALLMTKRRVSCLLITDQADNIKGIVTDSDLRAKVVAYNQDNQVPVFSIMTSPLISAPQHTVCFNAMLEMMKHRVHHLPIKHNGNIMGLLSAHDLIVLQGTSPLYLVREIISQNKIENIYELSLKSPRVVRTLIYEGAKPAFITHMITLINNYILERVLTLLIKELGPPPVPFCWMVMGSEGRKEQSFRTDQDNGLIYADPIDIKQTKISQKYFNTLATQAIEHLVRCGFPRCEGNIMASNPKWCQPFSSWMRTFDKWISTPDATEILYATIFFDFRVVYGHLNMGVRLRKHLMQSLNGQNIFFRQLAKDCITTPATLSFLRNFMVEKRAPYTGKLNLKTKGFTPFVDFARLMSLKSGIWATNTLERFQLLKEGGFISNDFYFKISQAYEFLMHLRLIHQQRMHEEGLEPNNFINPNNLNSSEKYTLKEALSIIGDIKSYLKEVFRLASV